MADDWLSDDVTAQVEHFGWDLYTPEMEAHSTRERPRLRWRCRINGCWRRGYTGLEGWERHVAKFHTKKTR